MNGILVQVGPQLVHGLMCQRILVDSISRKKKIMIKMFMLSLYLLYIVNTSKTCHVSKMLDIVGICVNSFNETLV